MSRTNLGLIAATTCSTCWQSENVTVGAFDVVAGRTPSDADVELELRKWQQAQAFCNLTHQIDFAYDGVFWQADVDDFCSTMQVTVPDIIFVGEYT